MEVFYFVDTVLDSTPNQLRDPEEHLELVDTAFFFDTSCPPLLRPERKVDVILHFNYTGGSQTKVRVFLEYVHSNHIFHIPALF